MPAAPPRRLSLSEAHDRALSALAGLWPGRAVVLEPLQTGLKPRRATVFRVTGGPQAAVVKLWAPAHATQAAAQSARQAKVAEAMAEGRWRAVPVLGFDAAQAALVMGDPGGPDLAADLAAGAGAVAALREAGSWLAAFHETSLRRHPFRPAGHLHWLNHLLGEAEAGRRLLPDPAGFARAVAALEALAPSLRGQPSCRAVTHRDLTLSNLLRGAPGQIWGIDFENDAEDEPLRDLFTLALDALARGHGPEALAALRQGYGPGGASPEIGLFLQRAFALGVLAHLPARPSARQAARAAAAGWILRQQALVL